MGAEASYQATFRYSYKRWVDHFRGAFSHPVRLVIRYSAILTAMFGLYQLADYFFKLDWKNSLVCLALCVFCFVAAFAWEVLLYVNECPEGLESVPLPIRRVAHLKRTKWEFEFAKRLLASRIGPIRKEYQGITDGTTYVAARAFPSFKDYKNWMVDRPANIRQMLEVSNKVLFTEYAKSLHSTEEKHALPKNILAATEMVERLYRDSVEFERERRSIIPPDKLQHLHELQAGWSQPIRDGIEQLFQFLQTICDARAADDTKIHYSINYESPLNLDAYKAELDRIERDHPEAFIE